MAARTRYRLPLNESVGRKFDALERLFELRVLGTALPGSPTQNGVFRLQRPFRPRKLDGAHLGGLAQGLGLEDEDVGPGAQWQVGRVAAVETGRLALVEAARARDVGDALAAAGVIR